jgi:hypothetical protein
MVGDRIALSAHCEGRLCESPVIVAGHRIRFNPDGDRDHFATSGLRGRMAAAKFYDRGRRHMIRLKSASWTSGAPTVWWHFAAGPAWNSH